MKVATDFLNAIAAAAWPLLVAIALFKLFPFIKSFLSRDKITFKIAGMEISGEQITESLSNQVKDLQTKFMELERKLVPTSESAVATESPGARGDELTFARIARVKRKILWVDDKPEKNALEAQKFLQDGHEVTFAKTTGEGIQLATGGDFDVIISDMGRWEGIAHYVSDAGLQLVRQLRQANITAPIILFTTARALENYGSAARELGVFGSTNSALDLYRLVDAAFKKSN